MTCDVFDQLFLEGLRQPHIGTFTLQLGDLVQEMRSKDAALTLEMHKIIKILKKIVKQQAAGGHASEVLGLESLVKENQAKQRLDAQNEIGIKFL